MDPKKKEEALKRAIEMEWEGKKFYQEAAGKAESLLARNIFQELAAEEDLHARKIQEVFDRLAAGREMEKWIVSVNDPRRLGTVFQESLADMAGASSGDVEALKFALSMEEKSINHYEGLAQATPVPQEKRFYLALSYEERGHYLNILDSIEYLTDPGSWFRLKEGAMADGG